MASPVEGSRKLVFGYDYMSRRVRRQVFTYDATAEAWRTTAEEDVRFVYDGWNVILELDALDDDAVNRDPIGEGTTTNLAAFNHKRRARAAGLPEGTCCHTFGVIGITAYLDNGGTIENAQAIAAHESPRTTKLYDHTSENRSEARRCQERRGHHGSFQRLTLAVRPSQQDQG